MRILQVHNQYRHYSGEDAVVDAEYKLLKQYGHEVEQWFVDSSTINQMSKFGKAKTALGTIWSDQSYRQIQTILKNFPADVVHIHNTVPLISPSVYAACQCLNIPVVQSLHNFRLICPGSYLYRDSQVCKACVGKAFPIPAIQHGCYRKNHLQSTIIAATNALGYWSNNYANNVSIYIAMSKFSRQKFIEGGLPAEKIAIKPNFIPYEIEPGNSRGQYAVFVGKLVTYKGVETLLKAWNLLTEEIPLKIAGQGPLEILLTSNLPPHIEYLGLLPREETIKLIQNASFLIFPSEWYEGFPVTITEALATGTPVIASKLSVMAEIVRDGISGWHFTPGNAEELAQVVQQAWSHPEEVERRGRLARKQYEDYYSMPRNYEMMMNIYQMAIKWSREGKPESVF